MRTGMTTIKTLLCGILMLVRASSHFAVALHSSFNSTGEVNRTNVAVSNASEAWESTTKHPAGPGVPPVWSNFTARFNSSVHEEEVDSGVTNVTHVPATKMSTNPPTTGPNLNTLSTLPTSDQSDPSTPRSPMPKSPTPAPVDSPSTTAHTETTPSTTALLPLELSTKIQVSTSRDPITTNPTLTTNPAGVVNPKSPKGPPVITKEVSNLPTEVKTCSTYNMVKYCLIAITCLAGLATAFMVSTVILCVKLSKHKYKLKKCSDDTEMMCISSILPEVNGSSKRYRSHVSNGVLVIHATGDSDDDDIDDNLTLSSFLPENDKHVV